MSFPNLLSTAELPDGSVPEGRSTVHNGFSDFESASKPRSYQLEMLEESMRRNIIVAVRLPWFPFSSSAANTSQMETGSGKT